MTTVNWEFERLFLEGYLKALLENCILKGVESRRLDFISGTALAVRDMPAGRAGNRNPLMAGFLPRRVEDLPTSIREVVVVWEDYDDEAGMRSAVAQIKTGAGVVAELYVDVQDVSYGLRINDLHHRAVWPDILPISTIGRHADGAEHCARIVADQYARRRLGWG